MIEDENVDGKSLNENMSTVEDTLVAEIPLDQEKINSSSDNDDVINNKTSDTIFSNNCISAIGIDEENDEDEDDFLIKSRIRNKIILSDDESDEELNDRNIENKNDSDDNDLDALENGMDKTKTRIRRISNSDDEENFNSIESPEENLPIKVQYRSDIFDTEESDEETRCNTPEDMEEGTSRNIPEDMEENVEGKKESTKTKKTKKENKVSDKKRRENLLEIHSTTQKMVRESEIVLPYHRPKQRTLMEFLNREIEERKKEVDKFYKSDDNDDDDDGEENERMENESSERKDSNEENSDKDLYKKIELELCDIESTGEDKVLDNKNDKILGDGNEKVLDENELPDLNPTEEKKENDLDKEQLNEVRNDSDDVNSDTTEKISSCTPSELELRPKNTEDVEELATLETAAAVEENNCNDYDSEDDFKLHLDTEEFDNDSNFCPESEMKNCLKDLSSEIKNNSSGELKEKSNTIKTPKFNLLASKFPQLDLNNLKNITPKLSEGKDSYIDLEEEEDFVQKRGIDSLLNRFIEHSKKKKTSNNAKKVSLGIVSKEVNSEGNEKLVHSNIIVDINEEDETPSTMTTPGARLSILKASLRAKLLEQREKERQRRVKEKEFLDSEKVIQDYHDDGLPDDEAELTDQSDTDAETESEPEENDVIIEDKKRKKNKYLDEEAEEDDDMVSDDDENAEEDDNDCDDADTNSKMDVDDDDECDNDEEMNTQQVKRKSTLRIIEDDDDDNIIDDNNRKDNAILISYSKPNSEDFKLCVEDTEDIKEYESLPKEESGVFSFSRASTEDLFSSQMGEENNVNRDLKTSDSLVLLDQSFELMGSVIPAAQRSKRESFQSKSEAEVSVSESPSCSLTPFSNLKDVTQTQEPLIRENSSKSECTSSALNFLFTPVKESQINSSNTNALRRCLQLDTPSKNSQIIPSTGSELLDLCSGTFTPGDPRSSTDKNTEDLVNLCSGVFDSLKPVKEDSTNVVPSDFPENSNCASSGSDTVIPSDTEEPAEVKLSSDEEQDLEEEKIILKKKRKRILNADLSDDENENEEVVNNEDGEDLLSEEEAIEYDENEEPILQTEKFKGFKDAVRGGIRSDFLEKEAELSGSEEGSDDEEEPDEDNDFMEQEEGDTEKFDVDELRNQVGRAHLKSLIDSDKREIRLLQEMYLEDGDLHGEGRQRKFRWKNINGIDDDDNQISEDEEKEEAEEETDWRKERFEREKYLLEKDKEEEEEEDTNTPTLQKSSSLKLARNLSIKKSVLTPSNETRSQETSLFQSSLKKRGSFLARDNSTLERLASFAKENVVSNVVGGARQGGNFVFQTLTVEEVEKRSKEVEAKRVRDNIGKPPLKKMRIERSFFSMEETVQSLSVFKHL
ncbi:Claspin [Armadillidium vulgare]|nr:Claspin [Armadillidium vulgare]